MKITDEMVANRAAAKLELWFFRDMLEGNRLALFSLFGFKAADMDTMEKQRMVFRRITAALAAQTQQGVEVKKLEWEERGDSSHCAPSHIGHYHIFPGTGFSYDLCGPVGGRLATFKRLEAAKAAAQSDYEQRIRSAICGGDTHV